MHFIIFFSPSSFDFCFFRHRKFARPKFNEEYQSKVEFTGSILASTATQFSDDWKFRWQYHNNIIGGGGSSSSGSGGSSSATGLCDVYSFKFESQKME